MSKRPKALNLLSESIFTKLPPIDREIKRILEEYCADYEEALKKGEGRRAKPLVNPLFSCPACKSRECFPLYGGTQPFICAGCKTTYGA